MITKTGLVNIHHHIATLLRILDGSGHSWMKPAPLFWVTTLNHVAFCHKDIGLAHRVESILQADQGTFLVLKMMYDTLHGWTQTRPSETANLLAPTLKWRQQQPGWLYFKEVTDDGIFQKSTPWACTLRSTFGVARTLVFCVPSMLYPSFAELYLSYSKH